MRDSTSSSASRWMGLAGPMLIWARMPEAICTSSNEPTSRSSPLAKGEDREVGSFEEVQIASGIRAQISIGPARPIHLEADDDVLSRIETVVEDGTLRVGFKRNSHFHFDT